MRSRLRYAVVSVLIASVPVVLTALATRRAEGGRAPEPLSSVLAYGAAEWYPWALIAPFIDRRVRRSRATTPSVRVRVFAGPAALLGAFPPAPGPRTAFVAQIAISGEARWGFVSLGTGLHQAPS